MTTDYTSGPTCEHRIAVGVDGSSDSEQALIWAVREARLRGARVHAVLAWHVPGVPFGGLSVPPSQRAEALRAAEYMLGSTLRRVADEIDGVSVVAEAREGTPTEVLRHASEGADLLVLGTRGHARISKLILGSVSKYMTTHAHCPVVVVPNDPAARQFNKPSTLAHPLAG